MLTHVLATEAAEAQLKAALINFLSLHIPGWTGRNMPMVAASMYADLESGTVGMVSLIDDEQVLWEKTL